MKRSGFGFALYTVPLDMPIRASRESRQKRKNQRRGHKFRKIPASLMAAFWQLIRLKTRLRILDLESRALWADLQNRIIARSQ